MHTAVLVADLLYLFCIMASKPLSQGMAMKEDNEVQVTLEDQKKINLFARKNSRLNELKNEIENARKKLQNVEDAGDDLILLDEDDTKSIGYKIGEVFVQHSLDNTQELLEDFKLNLQEEISDLEGKVDDIRTLLKDLKVQLYAKFGDTINLEDDA